MTNKERMMKTLGAAEAKNHFGNLLDMAQREPVVIEKKGRAVAVVLSVQEYERLQALEEAWWIARATEAQADGFIGTDESEALIRDLLNV